MPSQFLRNYVTAPRTRPGRRDRSRVAKTERGSPSATEVGPTVGTTTRSTDVRTIGGIVMWTRCRVRVLFFKSVPASCVAPPRFKDHRVKSQPVKAQDEWVARDSGSRARLFEEIRLRIFGAPAAGLRCGGAKAAGFTVKATGDLLRRTTCGFRAPHIQAGPANSVVSPLYPSASPLPCRSFRCIERGPKSHFLLLTARSRDPLQAVKRTLELPFRPRLTSGVTEKDGGSRVISFGLTELGHPHNSAPEFQKRSVARKADS
ncbi:hypothetical protein H6P81_001557 [Aristolochia fimbriata]|uniref:Uncharacterized protein n=1 Tax=Aristolochia fimbriata TaxID=158543 RepID=A0AAV7F7X5_ARIFI|nr:hypothetical protein H6P81_001557 [Aristolochia fimbriata]